MPLAIGTSLSVPSPGPWRLNAVQPWNVRNTLATAGERSAQLTRLLRDAFHAVLHKLQFGQVLLATVGSTAPFVGLLGTVWGIYHALLAIGLSGQAALEKVAGPVGEALIMTALGLAVAVPAVLGYNWLVRRNRVALHGVKGFGSELHTLLLVEIEKSQRSAGSSNRSA